MKHTIRSISLAAFALLLAGCASHSANTLSGSAYLERKGIVAGQASNAQTSNGQTQIEQPGVTPAPQLANQTAQPANPAASAADPFQAMLIEAAAVEPLLQFPARIGIARIGRTARGATGITPIPSHEGDVWLEAARNLGDGFGEFVPVDGMIERMVTRELSAKYGNPRLSLIQRIRLAAARQHLDAVLIYEVHERTDIDANLLALADITLIGGFILPSRSVETEALALAVLLDPINAYNYGTARASSEKTGVTSAFARDQARRNVSKAAGAEAIENLGAEVTKMFWQLRTEIAEKR